MQVMVITEKYSTRYVLVRNQEEIDKACYDLLVARYESGVYGYLDAARAEAQAQRDRALNRMSAAQRAILEMSDEEMKPLSDSVRNAIQRQKNSLENFLRRSNDEELDNVSFLEDLMKVIYVEDGWKVKRRANSRYTLAYELIKQRNAAEYEDVSFEDISTVTL